ncbi:MAG: hypothetical protein ABI158_11440 [Edaphobacter sp.]
MASLLAGALLTACTVIASAAQSGEPNVVAATPAEVSFQFERLGLPVPSFAVRVHEDGTGSYQAEEVEGPSDGGAVRYATAKHIDRTINLTPATVAKIFDTARELKHFAMDCESKAKNVANTGKKTLSYTGPDGTGSCVYNYSDQKDVEMLTKTFIAIAYTLDEGRRLEYLHRYDRLGLDAETIALEHAVKAGQALEVGTIAPVLTAIAADTAVMQRVRQRIARLLEQEKGNRI